MPNEPNFHEIFKCTNDLSGFEFFALAAELLILSAEIIVAVLIGLYEDIEVFCTPFLCGGVGREEHIQAVAAYNSAAVKDLNGSFLVVSGDNHFRTERYFSVGCDEGIAVLYPVPAGGNAV